jgi:hypothetical protein
MLAAHCAGNILEIVLNLAPIPYLDTSFSILKAIYASIKHVRGIRAQMTALASTVAELLYNLNIKLQEMHHLDRSIQMALHDFNSLLTDICETTDRYSKKSYLKIFFTPRDLQSLINQHHLRISQVSSNFQTHLQMTIHNDIRKFEEARKEDHRELLGAIDEMKKDKRQFVQAANDAMRDESPLTEKDVKEYFTITDVDVTTHERELEHDIVNKMLKCLNRSSVLVPPQYVGSTSTGWSPEQYSPNHPPSYPYSEEPAVMAEAESRMPLDRPYPPRRPAYPPFNGGYPTSEAPSPYAPRYWNTDGIYSQPYNMSGQSTMQMPMPQPFTANSMPQPQNFTANSMR